MAAPFYDFLQNHLFILKQGLGEQVILQVLSRIDKFEQLFRIGDFVLSAEIFDFHKGLLDQQFRMNLLLDLKIHASAVFEKLLKQVEVGLWIFSDNVD